MKVTAINKRLLVHIVHAPLVLNRQGQSTGPYHRRMVNMVEAVGVCGQRGHIGHPELRSPY